MKLDAVIVGGGAAGMMCAIAAGRRGRRVAVLEHNAEIGRKILISGGGRCNFTNASVGADNFVSENPHFAKSALARYTPDDFVELVRRHRIDYYEKTLGQLFTRHGSRRIVEMLSAEAGRAGAVVRTGCAVASVTRVGGEFVVATGNGDYRAPKLVVAAGGLSFPKIGATGVGYDIARRFGHRIVPTRPSLVPLVFDRDRGFGKLAGVSADSVVTSGRRSFRENILFTHRGLSGPAILQISNYWNESRPVTIDLLPTADLGRLLYSESASGKSFANFLGRLVPARLADAMAGDLAGVPLNRLRPGDFERAAALVHEWEVGFRETEGWHKAEVTIGGVDTRELSSQTMESKKAQGLYFVGEVVDVTGWLGGYNFQWAWASGHAAGTAI